MEFFCNIVYSYWLVWDHMASNNKTVFPEKSLWAGKMAKSMTWKGNRSPLPMNIDCSLKFIKSLHDWSLGK